MNHEATLTQKGLAEMLGTFMLVFFGGMAVILSGSAGALKFESYADLLAIGLAFGLALAGAIHTFGKICGAHYNPAVTLAMLVTRRIPANQAGVYILAQIVGAMLAALFQAIIFNFDATRVFITMPAPTATFTAATIAEMLGTFFLVSVIFGVAVDGRAPAGWAGWMIGMAIPTGALAVGPISGASFNPAVSLGPRIVASLTGANPDWSWMVVYLIGPIAGGIIAAFIYDAVMQPKRVSEPIKRAINSEPSVAKKRQK